MRSCNTIPVQYRSYFKITLYQIIIILLYIIDVELLEPPVKYIIICLLGPMAWMTSVMNEEEYQKHRVCRWKCDASDNVDGLCDTYRVWWHFTFIATVAPDILLLLKKRKRKILVWLFMRTVELKFFLCLFVYYLFLHFFFYSFLL